MNNELAEDFSKHKAAFIGVAIAGVFVLVLLSKRGGNTSPASSLIGAQLTQNQLDAQVAVANQQANAQNYASQIQANATAEQYKAAEDASNTQTYAALISSLASTQAENHYTDVSGQVATTQIGAQQHMFDTEYNTSLSALEDTNATSEHIAQLEQQLASQQITARSNENKTILDAVNKAGLNHGTTSLEENLTGIIGEVLGQPQVAVAGESASAYTQAAHDAETASIFGSITNGISSAISNLLR